ncbi:helix-turn-helix transcriptional regulator [Saccharibacillus alkalitolerans]|uniref:Helix-turn-helix domain-containing protein n=1 Tax=Saccharibacillus alkalitolerans TaxID=2705290 RepID=A0ABX0FDT2_9BACL|nr:helix-turn-helix transcriptional regulator [Saccharibacillus alkalitolerans]NGZ76572.1 helix-turn-helix domain-containing protein [Saccharibacillus alkalitolerans]
MREESKKTKPLAEFLRTRRARLTPEQVGLPVGGRRRTQGLRREEVAVLAGISVDWYTWLEQGRDIQVSAQVLDSLSRTLRLDPQERRHLFLLAAGHPPAERHEPQLEVSPLLQMFLDRQGDSPAFAVNARWDIVGWNRAAALVFGDYEAMSARERNTIWRLFTTEYARRLLGEQWEQNARHRLAQFRANYAHAAGDPWWEEMIADLQACSGEFREWWPLHQVLHAPEGEKRLMHPTAGILRFGHLSLQAIDSADLQVTVNLPLDAETRERMKRLLETGG